MRLSKILYLCGFSNVQLTNCCVYVEYPLKSKQKTVECIAQPSFLFVIYPRFRNSSFEKGPSLNSCDIITRGLIVVCAEGFIKVAAVAVAEHQRDFFNRQICSSQKNHRPLHPLL